MCTGCLNIFYDYKSPKQLLKNFSFKSSCFFHYKDAKNIIGWLFLKRGKN